jgi:hypothetical protein
VLKLSEERMDEEALRLEMRLAAIEYVVCNFIANVYRSAEIPPKQVLAAQADLIQRLRNQTFPGLDAALSDLAAAELENAVSRLLDMQREMLGLPRNEEG